MKIRKVLARYWFPRVYIAGELAKIPDIPALPKAKVSPLGNFWKKRGLLPSVKKLSRDEFSKKSNDVLAR